MTGDETGALRVGTSWERDEELCEAPLAGLAALLDKTPQEWRGRPLPPLAHWLYCLPRAAQSQLGPDGHPANDDIVPPRHLPRRMWAGGRIEFLAPLIVGNRVTRRSVVTAVEEKTGRSGPLLFVTVRHEWCDSAGVALRESQDLVYRAAAAQAAPPTPAAESGIVAARPIPAPSPRALELSVAARATSAPAPTAVPARASAPGQSLPAAASKPPAGAASLPPGSTRRIVRPDPVLLFRFSALTFNAHRIHYDRTYSRQVEGYPSLVVHGPLVAMLMMDHLGAVTHDAPLESFAFRNQGPLFEGAEFSIEAAIENEAVALAAIDFNGHRAVSASAVLRR